jgi:hypothetical protein
VDKTMDRLAENKKNLLSFQEYMRNNSGKAAAKQEKEPE